MTFYSQDGQDKYLHENVFKGFRNGTFVDVGAHDGKSLNNTLFFEETLGWRGINIEPLQQVFEKLKATRPRCINLNVAVDTKEGTAEFYANDGHTEMLSGLVRHFHQDHTRRVKNEIETCGGACNTVPVRTRPLQTILREQKIEHVHYLSVDVEGAELAVLQSIDFSKVFIDCIQFECNYEDRIPPILDLLRAKGYRQIYRGSLDIFMLHEQSRFGEPVQSQQKQ
jgi:FkbM family methyltransferase